MPPVFSSVDLKLVLLRSSLVNLRSCECYYSITYNYHAAQPYSHPHSHTIGTVNTQVTRRDRTRDSATPSLLLIIPPFFLFHPKTNAASKQRRKLCT